MTIDLAVDEQGEAQATARTKLRGLDETQAPRPSAYERPLDEDDHLLRLIARHDESAFRRLVERHVDRA